MMGSEIGRGPRRAAMAAAAMIVALAGGQARAGIVYQAINQTLTTNSSTKTPQYDLTADGQVIGSFKGSFTISGSVTTAETDFVPASTTSYVGLDVGLPQTLNAGDLISSGSSFYQGQTMMSSYNYDSYWDAVGYSGQFAVTSDAYLGISFELNGATRYGWVQISDNGGWPTADNFVITAFAYDDTGAAIEAGQTVSAVPEPSSMLLLGLGGVGLTTCGLLRRRAAVRTVA